MAEALRIRVTIVGTNAKELMNQLNRILPFVFLLLGIDLPNAYSGLLLDLCYVCHDEDQQNSEGSLIQIGLTQVSLCVALRLTATVVSM